MCSLVLKMDEVTDMRGVPLVETRVVDSLTEVGVHFIFKVIITSQYNN